MNDENTIPGVNCDCYRMCEGCAVETVTSKRTDAELSMYVALKEVTEVCKDAIRNPSQFEDITDLAEHVLFRIGKYE